jgi:hypothetical protein
LQENLVFLHAAGDFQQENGVRLPDGWQFIDHNWPVGLSRQRFAQYRAQSPDAFAATSSPPAVGFSPLFGKNEVFSLKNVDLEASTVSFPAKSWSRRVSSPL